MDRREARAVAEERLSALRGQTYAELSARYSLDQGNEPTWETAIGPSGVVYQLKLYAFWDDRPNRDLRVWVDADDGRKSAFRRPETVCFIIAPDGSFVGE